jgi:galactose mutarotase-like enzyme
MATKVASGSMGGFATATLRNAHVSVTVVPALGARLLSLRSVQGAREWLWRPDDGRGLFSCAAGTAFEDGPLAGADECMPTVLPCVVGGQAIPDHGEVWNRAWTIDPNEEDAITTRIELQTRPLGFARRLSLDGNEVRLDYTLTNRSGHPATYLWALHPLFTLEAGDEVALQGQAEVAVQGTHESAIAPGEQWPWPGLPEKARLDRAETGALARRGQTDSYLKAFLRTAQAPAISLVDARRGERLTLKVSPDEVAAWGYWVSRGGWFGHTHIALEATNASADGLDELAPGNPAHTLAPREVRKWTVRIALSADRVESARARPGQDQVAGA